MLEVLREEELEDAHNVEITDAAEFGSLTDTSMDMSKKSIRKSEAVCSIVLYLYLVS